MKTLKKLALITFSLTLFFSCSNDDDNNPLPVNEEEVITTVKFILTPIGTTAPTVVIQSQDLDGDGPDSPVITTTGTINASTNYTGEIEFLNELESPAENITLEVIQEADEHQVFFLITGSAGSTLTYNDQDINGNPIGVNFDFDSGVASTDNVLTLTLRHEPNKFATGVSDGLIANAGGETDVQVVFNYDVQ